MASAQQRPAKRARGEATTPTAATASPQMQETALPNGVKDLTTELGVEAGARVDVLWVLEDVDTLESTEIWWPATVLPPTGAVVVLEGGSAAVSVVDTPLQYDFNERFPDWSTEEDLAASVSFIHPRVLVDNDTGKGTFWRAAGSQWTAQASSSLVDGVRDMARAPEELAARFVETFVVPFFAAHRHRLTQQQELAFAENVATAKQEFVRVVQDNVRTTPCYLETMTDETVLHILQAVARTVAGSAHAHA